MPFTPGVIYGENVKYGRNLAYGKGIKVLVLHRQLIQSS